MKNSYDETLLSKKYIDMYDYNSFFEENIASLKQQISDVSGPLLNDYAKQLVEAFNNNLASSDDFKHFSNVIDSLKKSNICISSEYISEISKSFISNIDFSSINDSLSKNIEIIRSILNDDETDKSKINDIDFNIPFPNDISVAEMEATINGEEYIKPDLDYKKFDVLLATMSFISDPVKATNILSQLIYFADHSVNMTFKIQIYSALKEQIVALIAGGIIGVALFVIDVLLNYFLKDNEIYKKFIKLKRFNKER